MQQLIYVSYASDDFQSGDVFKIIETSARNNPTRDVTGFLVYAHDTFVQFVEGPAASLDALLNDLKADSRHQRLEVLERREGRGRCFPNWRMERLAVSGGDARILEQKLRQTEISQATIARLVETIMTPRMAA